MAQRRIDFAKRSIVEQQTLDSSWADSVLQGEVWDDYSGSVLMMMDGGLSTRRTDRCISKEIWSTVTTYS